MKRKEQRADANHPSPMLEVTLENLDVTTIPEGGVQIRVPLDMVFRDEFQPRKKFGQAKMAELAESLKNQGPKQYPRLRWQYVDSKLRFVIDDGERRTRNYRTLGWKDAIFTPFRKSTHQNTTPIVSSDKRPQMLPKKDTLMGKLSVWFEGLSQANLQTERKVGQISMVPFKSLLRRSVKPLVKAWGGQTTTTC